MTSSRTDRLVVRSRLGPWLVGLHGLCGAGCAALAVAADRSSTRWTLLLAAVVFGGLAVRAARMSIIADPAGLTARQLGSTRRLLWSQIAEFGIRDHVLIAARLTDGREVALLHYRGLGDLTTDRAAGSLDSWARRHRRTGDLSTAPPHPRRLSRGAVLGLAVLLVAGSLTYAVWSGHWSGVAAGMAAVLMGRYLKSGPGDGREFRPVPPPADAASTAGEPPAGGGPGPGPSRYAAD